MQNGRTSVAYRTGILIRKARKDADLGGRELARRVDVTSGYISDLELGRRLPSNDVIRKIALATGVNPEPIIKAAAKERIDKLREQIEDIKAEAQAS